jgi:hypothetical protein
LSLLVGALCCLLFGAALVLLFHFAEPAPLSELALLHRLWIVSRF